MPRKKKSLPTPSNQLVESLLKDSKSYNVGDLADQIITELGGINGFAKLYAKEINNTDEGSIARARMLDGIMRLVTNASAQRKDLARDEADLSDEELVAELSRILAQRRQKGEKRGSQKDHPGGGNP